MKMARFVACALIAPSLPLAAQQGLAHPAISPAPAAVQAPQPTPATGPVVGPNSPVDSATYIIGADDSLMLNVWKEPNLSGPLVVRPDGAISVPLLGDVPAAGQTPMQLSHTLTDRLQKFVTDPTVTVVVTSVNSKRVFFVGQVNHVGPLTISPGMTLLQAISTAGGLTPFANSKKIYILRGPQGSQKKIFFNYKTAVKNGDQQGVVLIPGDTIVVP